MGIMGLLLSVFSNAGAIKGAVEVFRPNAEAEAQRESSYQSAALGQYAAEFNHAKKGWFDRFIDGLNRLPRPAMALGTLSLIASAMIDPVWFGERMQGLQLVPEQLWWLLGAVVTFYFGAREAMKSRDFSTQASQVTEVVRSIDQIRSLNQTEPSESGNPALDDWRNELKGQTNDYQ
jgi:hypothetical protein